MLLGWMVGLVGALVQAAPARQVGVPIGTGTQKPQVRLDAPVGGWSVDRMLLVQGSVSDKSVNPVVVSINGDRYLMRTYDGSFSRKFPAAAGHNIVSVAATNRGGSSSAQATCYAQIPPVPLKAVLTSDTDGVYTDLHIYEPTDKSEVDGEITVQHMQHVYWLETASPSGGTFFLNAQGESFDQPGYGPYLYVHRAPPKGIYLIATNYWPSGDMAQTLATLNVVLFEGTPHEQRRKVQIPLATPGTTRALAWVNMQGADSGSIYIPGADLAPMGRGWPKNLAHAVSDLQTN